MTLSDPVISCYLHQRGESKVTPVPLISTGIQNPSSADLSDTRLHQAPSATQSDSSSPTGASESVDASESTTRTRFPPLPDDYMFYRIKSALTNAKNVQKE